MIEITAIFSLIALFGVKLSYISIFENSQFIIVAKKSEIEFHGEGGIVEVLRRDYSEIHGVHRLDKATSGLMVFAKNKTVQASLSELFRYKKIEKTYIALSDKKPSKKQGMIKGDLEKTRNGSYKITRNTTNPSLTKFKSFFDKKMEIRGFFLFPFTGKTHQLRVALKSLGTPIIGDNRYGGTSADRMYLHAFSLKFEYNGELFHFTNYPDEGELFAGMKMSFNDYNEMASL
jgi:tRNA pseudouridine32 synthase/23S rRNA pseudouridine746 synthase